MGVDTNAILIGAPSPQEMAAVLRNEFDCEVSIECGAIDDLHKIYLQDPLGRPKHGNAGKRMMFVWPNCHYNDYQHVYSGPMTLCSLGAFGGSVVIMEALARHFGGFVINRDTSDEWRFIDRSDMPMELPPRDRLRIEIEKIVGSKAAIPLIAVADDVEAMDRLIAAYGAYRATA